MDALLQNLISIMREYSWLAPLLSFLSGFLTGLTPCAISQLPLIIGYVSAGSTSNRANIKASIFYALGISITFTLLGILAGGIGQILTAYFSYWLIFLGILMIFMAFETSEITSFIPTSNMIGRIKSRGNLGAFLIGAVSGIFSSPCATPVLIFILSIISSKQNIFFGIVMMILYSIGYSMITILAGSLVGFVKSLKQSKKYEKLYNISKYTLSVIMILIGFYLFYEGI